MTPLLLWAMALIDVLPTVAETGLGGPAPFPGRNVLIRGDLTHIIEQPIRQISCSEGNTADLHCVCWHVPFKLQVPCASVSSTLPLIYTVNVLYVQP